MEGFIEVLHCKVFYCMLHLIVLQAGSIYSEVTADQSSSGDWTSGLPPVLEQKVSRTKSGETKEKKKGKERNMHGNGKAAEYWMSGEESYVY